MKKYSKLLLCFILCLTVVISVCPVHAEAIAKTNVTWEQQADVLYISGTGDMVVDFEYITEIPWYSIRNEISKIVIGEGITSISDSAFADFRLVREVQFPNSLRVIGPAAFITCTSLETLVLPYKITRIEDGAFVNCESMTSITIPGSITEIAEDAFYNCYNVSIIGVNGTYAKEYAKEHNIPFSAGIGPSEEILVRVDGEYVNFDQPPAIVNDRTLVPVRAIFESMGIEVSWNASSRTVTATRGNTSISLAIDSNIINKTVYGVASTVEIDVPAQIIGDRTMVPARAVAQSFGASVNWDGETRTVIIQD
ncbi:MAG: leucine-rich repeat protein [Clostridia bacterium]|nr:leucine-rich repeat protein [Clostridia bacterium]